YRIPVVVILLSREQLDILEASRTFTLTPCFFRGSPATGHLRQRSSRCYSLRPLPAERPPRRSPCRPRHLYRRIVCRPSLRPRPQTAKTHRASNNHLSRLSSPRLSL